METAVVEVTDDDQRAEKRRLADEQAEQGAEVLRELAVNAPMIPGTDLAIIPPHKEMQGLAAMAVTLAGAQALPAALRNRPNDVFLILLTARDLGVATTTAIREFHVIDGRVTISPKAKLAMVNERGRREGWAVWPDPSNNAESATWHATRADRPGVEFSFTFTKAEARTAGLANKGNWQSYPQRMLSWRALGYLLDDVFPEIGTGLYSPDELGAVTDEDGVPVIDVHATEPLPGMTGPKGQQAKTQPTDLTAEQLAERWSLQERVFVLPEDAKATLKERWGHIQRLRGHRLPELPPELFGLVSSTLRGIEQQQKAKGWDPDGALAEVREREARVLASLLCPFAVGPSAPPETQDDQSPKDEIRNAPEAAAEAAAEGDAGESEQPSLLTDELTDEQVEELAGTEQTNVTIALVKAMSMTKVDAQLVNEFGLDKTGNEDTRRARLTMAILRRMVAERSER